ncbi:hypothetical protein DFH27DRAFT_608506 [Peziza echinospora]|nr:hypothetical protein DFH27DRAFT_608506 [Peziza echinospora]
MVATATKASIWAIRFFQWSFAVVLMGVTAYLIHEFREIDEGLSSHSPRELVVPLVFSVLAIIFTSFAIIGLFFLNHMMQIASAILDFILFVGYLASAGLNRYNYHVRGHKNELWNKIVGGRVAAGLSPRRLRNDGLVRLLAALVAIQLILFFFTMLLQVLAAKKYRDTHTSTTGPVVREKTSPFNRFSRNSASTAGNQDDAYAPGNTATTARSAV